MPTSLAGRNLLSIADLTREEIEEIWRVSTAQKSGEVTREQQLEIAPGRTLAMLFDKSSLRTRLGFEVAMSQLGGHALYLAPADVRIGEREAVGDIARVLGRTVDAVSARLHSHDHITELASAAGVPVINAMSNLEHPCQALADLLTIREHKGDLQAVELAWVGDGYNVCHSLLLISGLFGVNLKVATPATYEPRADIVARAQQLAAQNGGTIAVGNDPQAAVTGADVVYTDVWISAGMDDQSIRRRADFKQFRVDQDLVKQAKPDAIVLHCLPAHRDDEITDEVMDGPQCAAFDQAENRLHTQRALLTLIFS
ncbi:MAG TPA: ornithine carbamoyltransferase [Armatimonadota bacterium]|nr:ornithine carbamoyltransferase [Armatimonadota bacterium]